MHAFLTGRERHRCFDRRRLRNVAVLTVSWGISLSACQGRTATETVYPAGALLYGRVTSRSGAPVQGVLITAAGYSPACGAGPEQASGNPPIAQPDAAGHYRLVVLTGTPTSLCVVARATTSTGVLLAEANATAVPFRLTVASGVAVLRDSAHVDLVVP